MRNVKNIFSILILTVILFSGQTLFASNLWDFNIGETRTYGRTDEAGNSWDSYLEVIQEVAFGGNNYYELTRTNYRGTGDETSLYFRSTETQIFYWDGNNEEILFQTGSVGFSWQDGNITREIIGVNHSTDVAYGTYDSYVYASYRNDYQNGDNPFIYHFVTSGLGMIKEIDFFTDDAPKVQELSGVSPVPEPATMLLFGIGLIGLAGVSRRKK